MKKRINSAFSLIETIISITIATIFIVLMVANTFMMYRSFNISRDKSEGLFQVSRFIDIISLDILNPDIFPRRTKEGYVFSDTNITFFANNKKVEYRFNGNDFLITKTNIINKKDDTDQNDLKTNDSKEEVFKFIKDFNIKYYNRDEFLVFDIESPYYCEMSFTFKDNKKITVNMRL